MQLDAISATAGCGDGRRKEILQHLRRYHFHFLKRSWILVATGD